MAEPSLSVDNCDNPIIETGKYYELGNESYLWAGNDSSTHFDVTDWSLSACNLRFGLGRESFNALTEPNYEKMSDADVYYPDTTRAVVVRSEKSVKVYPLSLLVSYETINESVDGDPVAIVYCHLADLVTVFSRKSCDDVLTFAVSGYTYVNRGLESFLLWDRNTESLWWPIDEIGVSGEFQNIRMNKYDLSKWGVSTVERIIRTYPNALILKPDQERKEIPFIPTPIGCR